MSRVLIAPSILSADFTRLGEVQGLAGAAEKLAGGDVNVTVEATTRDEVGQLSRAFKGMVENIQGQAAAAQSIAAGDLSLEVKPRSDADVLGKSIGKVVAR